MSEHSLTRQAMEAALRALEQQVQEEQAGTINSWLCPHFESCDPEGRIYTCSFALRKEYANPGGTLHGGLVGVIFDTAMGHLSALYAGGMTPTVTMNISYLRPVPVDGPVLVRSRLDKPGPRPADPPYPPPVHAAPQQNTTRSAAAHTSRHRERHGERAPSPCHPHAAHRFGGPPRD